VNPGFRQKQSNREADTTKRAKAEDESQSVFDAVASEEEEKAQQQQNDSKPSVGVTRQSDHVRAKNTSSRAALDTSYSTNTLRQISKYHTGSSISSDDRFLESL